MRFMWCGIRDKIVWYNPISPLLEFLFTWVTAWCIYRHHKFTINKNNFTLLYAPSYAAEENILKDLWIDEGNFDDLWSAFVFYGGYLYEFQRSVVMIISKSITPWPISNSHHTIYQILIFLCTQNSFEDSESSNEQLKPSWNCYISQCAIVMTYLTDFLKGIVWE